MYFDTTINKNLLSYFINKSFFVRYTEIKIMTTNITDNSPEYLKTLKETTDEMSKNSEHLTTNETTKKILKKKLKKERQKEKKSQLESKTAAFVLVNELSEKEKREQDIDDKSTDLDSETTDLQSEEDYNTINIDSGIEFPAFVQSIVNQKDASKINKNNAAAKNENVSKIAEKNNVSTEMIVDNEDDFVRVKKGTKQAGRIFCKTPEGFGEEAINMIREKHFELAINYLNRAIAMDPSDNRHYLNRSYCFLRTANYQLALDDIQYVINRTRDIPTLSIAKCRKGKCLAGLKNYEHAEKAFRESFNLDPNNMHALYEMKYVQILQLVQMGFSEREAILALEEKASFMEALVYLTETSVSNSDKRCYTPTITDYDCEDDDIFYSDTEDSPSNTKLWSTILKYVPMVSVSRNVKETSQESKKTRRIPSLDRNLRVIKAVVNQPKAKINNATINDKAIWVGNLSDETDETLLRKKFSRFGKIDSVRRPLNGKYAFVNFQSASSVQIALNEAAFNHGNIECNGFKFFVKQAATKPFKF